MSKATSTSSLKGKKKRRASSTPAAAPEQIHRLPVLKKVRNHPEFKELTEGNAKQIALELSERNELHSIYFSHLLDERCDRQCIEITQEAEMTNNGKDFVSKVETDAARARGAERFQMAAEMPIKLQLTELNRESLLSKSTMNRISKMFKLPFGPLHAALVVGDVTLEWDDHSLVVPRRVVAEPDLQIDVGKQASFTASIVKNEGAMKIAATNHHYEQQIDLVCKTTESRGERINALIEVILKYNCLYTYNVLQRNCQTFVIDAMRAMGIKDRPKMTGKLKEYFESLKKGKQIVPDEFPTHEDLDRYVQELQSNGQLANLAQHEKEYLLCIYFKFHFEAEDTEDEEWSCKVPNCMINKVDESIVYRLQLED